MSSEIIKIFVNIDSKVIITCPKCGQEYKKDVSKFFGYKKKVILKCTCKCKNTFLIFLQRRKTKRKKTFFKGFFIFNQIKVDMTVVNLSIQGLQIKIPQKIPVKINDILTINFILDNQNKSQVSEKIRIKWINSFKSSMNIGCEFLSMNHYGDLGKYLLFCL